MNDDPQELVTVGFFSQTEEAALARNQLESIGIKAVLGESDSAMPGLGLTGYQGGVRLLAARADAERAQDFLDSRPWLDADEEEKTGITTSRSITGITTSAALAEMAPHGDDEDDQLTLREQQATAAFKSAVFGLLMFPLLFYAVYLLLAVCFSVERLAGRSRTHAILAGVVLMPIFTYTFAVAMMYTFAVASSMLSR